MNLSYNRLLFALALLYCMLVHCVRGATVSAGGTHTCVVLESGGLKCFGANSFGQLGLGDDVTRGNTGGTVENLPFVDLDGNTAVSVAAAFSGTTCVLRGDSKVTCFGRNADGELAQGDRVQRGDDPHEVGNNFTTVDFGLDPDETILQLTSGEENFCTLSSKNRVRCWGGFSFGSFGLGVTGDGDYGAGVNQTGVFFHILDFGVTAKKLITTGRYFQCVLTPGGRVRCLGDNGFGQLGWTQGPFNTSTNPGNGNFWIGDNPNETGENLQDADLAVPPGDMVTSLCSGLYHTCALFETGRIKCWYDERRILSVWP